MREGNNTGYGKLLLAFSPMEIETNQNSQNHIDFFEFVLKIYGKKLENVVGLCGDNYNANRSIAKKTNIGFIGCASHRFNLFVKSMIEKDIDLCEQVRKIMKKLSNPICAAKLREHTSLTSVVSNVTRWSSTSSMLNRFLEIEKFLTLLNCEEIDDLLLRPRQVKQVERLNDQFKNFNSVTIALQSDKLSLADVRCLFDTVIEEYPEAKQFLPVNSKIVLNPYFESGIIKVLNNQEERLNAN